MSDTASVTVTLDAAGTLPLDQFNPALGTLTRVEVAITTTALVQVCIENTSAQAIAVGGGTSEGSLDAAFPGSVARATASAAATGAPTALAASNGTANCSAGFDAAAGRFAAPVIATDATFFQQTHVATNSATLTGSGQMSPYIGTGSVAVGYTPLNDTELVFPAEWQSTAVAQGQVQATVTYTYTPTGRQIPGTGSDTDRTVTIAGAIVLTGVAATLVARRRRSTRLAAGGAAVSVTSTVSARRSRLRAMGLATGGMVALLVANPAGPTAAAATQVEQGSVPLSSTSSTNPVALAQFDPADGALQQVTVTVRAQGSGDVDVTNLTPAARSTSVVLETIASVDGPAVSGLTASPSASQTQIIAAGATGTFAVTADGSQQQVIAAAPDLAAFIGTGTVTFDVTGFVLADIEGPATWTGSGNLAATATVEIEYQFDVAPVAVADTATVAEDSGASAVDVLTNDTDVDGGTLLIGAVTQPANGTVAITGGGTGLTYTPDPNYCNDPPGTTPDNFTYTLSPGSSTATVAIVVTCVDDAPVAVDDTGTVVEDAVSPSAIDVLANDTDVDGGPMSVDSVTQPAAGVSAITGGGTGASYLPDADFCGTDSFTYTLNGGSTATVTVTVTCVDDAPVAVDDAATVAEDSAATAVAVLSNDTDDGLGSITIGSASDPANGTVVITGGGIGLTYQPDADYCNDPPGTTLDTFTYTLNGGSSATVSLTVTCVDDAPVAVDDAATVAEDAAATAVVVLTNDTDIDGGPKTISAAGDPANGTVVITGGGTGLTYQPDADYCNDPPGTTPDTFTYTLNGGSSATVSVMVTCVDDAPVAVDDAATVAEDAAATPVSVLANDTDIDGGPTSIGAASDPANGAVVITGGGTGLTYQPDADYCNDPPGTTPDTFTYTLNGGSSATVSVTVTCVDDAPVAVDDAATVAEDAAATAVSVLANDTDVDGGTTSISAAGDPANGTVVLTGGTPGAHTGLTYQPDADYCNDPPGTTLDTFTYEVNGGSSATVSVTVTCVDDVPVAVDDAATVLQNTAPNAIDVLANDSDIDGGPKTISAAGDPANGTVVITGGGTGLTYQPDAAYCNTPPGTAPDTFTYTINGGSTATVSVAVNCDTPPVAVDDAATVAEDAAATAVAVLTNDTDVDGGPKTISSASDPTNGTVVLTGGTPGAHTGLTYQPDLDYCNDPPGTTLDTFTYELNGGSTATVSVTVSCVDDAPVAVDDAATVAEDAAATAVNVLTNDTDIDGGPKTISAAGDPANGTVVITGGGTGLTYQPDANYCNDPPGTTLDTFTYTLNGGSTATVSVTVTCVADAPVVTAGGTLAYTENDPATTVHPGLSVADPDGDNLTTGSASITGGYQAGQDSLGWTDNNLADNITLLSNDQQTVTLTGTDSPANYQAALRAVTFVNNSDNPSTASRTVTFSVADATTASGADTRAITVAAVDDPPVAVNDAATVLEDAAAPAVSVLTNDTDVDGGPKTIGSASDPANGTVVITGGGTGLTYQPDANYCNDPPGTTPDTFTYTLNGGSSATVSVTVTCVNDAPVADDETFNAANSAIGNTSLVADDPTDGAPNPADPHKTITGDILDGDSDVDGPGPLVITAGTFASNDGGSVTIEADGDFTFHPAAGTSCTDTSDFFDYTISDQNPGTPGTDTGRVTIAITNCVWYVSNNGTGNSGTSDAPFDTLAQAQTASAAGHTVFVFDGDNTTTGLAAGYTLDANERLLGEPAGLVVGVDTLRAAVPGAYPTITDNNADVIELAAGNEVRGLTIDPQGTGGGIAGGAGDAGGTIADVLIIDGGTSGTQPGLDLDGTSGTFNISNLTVSTNGAIGVRLNNAGTTNFLATGVISITTSGARGLDATSTNMGTSVFDDITVTGSGTGGVGMSATTGSTTFGDDTGTDLSLTTTSGATAAFSLSNAGTITVAGGGTDNISATGGPAVDVTGTSGATLVFDDVDSTNSANDGVNIAGLGSGTFSATSGDITGATGIAFDLDGGSGAITYAGNLNNGTGATAEVTNRSGGTVTLSGQINDTNDVGGGITLTSNTGGTTDITNATKTLNTGTSAAVTFTASNGHTLNFTGGNLDIDATSGQGINANDAGTVSVTGTGNSITTTTGTALNVVNTDIGASGLTFQSIAVNGATNGIVLNTTGSSGGLTVTGVGTTGGSGGTIQNTSGRGASVISSASLSLANMNFTSAGTTDLDADNSGLSTGDNLATNAAIHLQTVSGATLNRIVINGGAEQGINGNAVSNFVLSNSSITDAGNEPDEDGIHFYNMSGTSSITATTITSTVATPNTTGGDDHLNLQMQSGTLNLTISGGSATNANKGSGYLFGVRGTANATISFQTASSSGNFSGGIVADAFDSATMNLTVNGTTSSGNNDQLSVSAGDNSNVDLNATGNTLSSIATGDFVVVSLLGSAFDTGYVFDARIQNNNITVANGLTADGILVNNAGGGTINSLISGNTIDYAGTQRAIIAQAGQDGNGTTNLTITGNTIDVKLDGVGNAVTGIIVQTAITGPGNTSAMCADIGGAGALSNTFTHSLGGTMAGGDIRARQRNDGTMRLPGYGGGATDTAAVIAFLNGRNVEISTTTATADSSGFAGGAACAQPTP